MNTETTERRGKIEILMCALHILNGDCKNMDAPEYVLANAENKDHARVFEALQEVYGADNVPEYSFVGDGEHSTEEDCYDKNYSVIADAAYEAEQQLEPLLIAEAKIIAEMAIARKEEEGEILAEPKRDFFWRVKLELEERYSRQQEMESREEDVSAILEEYGYCFDEKEEEE